MKYKIFLHGKKEKQTVNHFTHRPRMNNWKNSEQRILIIPRDWRGQTIKDKRCTIGSSRQGNIVAEEHFFLRSDSMKRTLKPQVRVGKGMFCWVKNDINVIIDPRENNGTKAGKRLVFTFGICELHQLFLDQ